MSSDDESPALLLGVRIVTVIASLLALRLIYSSGLPLAFADGLLRPVHQGVQDGSSGSVSGWLLVVLVALAAGGWSLWALLFGAHVRTIVLSGVAFVCASFPFLAILAQEAARVN